jgi:hypothetical protein
MRRQPRAGFFDDERPDATRSKDQPVESLRSFQASDTFQKCFKDRCITIDQISTTNGHASFRLTFTPAK